MFILNDPLKKINCLATLYTLYLRDSIYLPLCPVPELQKKNQTFQLFASYNIEGVTVHIKGFSIFCLKSFAPRLQKEKM